MKSHAAKAQVPLTQALLALTLLALTLLTLTLLTLTLLTLAGCPRPPVKHDPPQTRAPAPPNELHVRFFAAGHGDAILLSTTDGHRVLVDAGRFVGGDHLVRRRLIPFFRKHRIHKLDAFVVTHPHPDHLGDPVMLRQHVTFNAIHTNADGAALLTSLTPSLHKAAGQGPPVRIVTLAQGDRLQFGQLHLRVLHPPKDAPPPAQVTSLSAQNDRSLVLRASYGAVKILLAADLTTRGEKRLLATEQPLFAHVLKVGHHGRGSTSDEWLRRVRPRYAVATCGDYMGRMQKVCPKLAARLKKHRVKLYRTDLHGDVVVVTDGRTLSVKTHPKHIYRPRNLK
jgi:competence protein ComEC